MDKPRLEGMPIYIILRDPPKKMISDQYQEYMSVVADRRRKASDRFYQVQKILSALPKCKRRKSDILLIAKKISEKTGINIDRSAKRIYDCLICWYCEN